MPNEIAPILAELRRDHRNMALLLNLLERETESIYEQTASDLGLMLEIMRYMTVFPDTVHHPNEDKLYAELRAARPDLAWGMARISEEHHTIGERSIRLREKLEEAVAGSMVRRDQIIADAHRYIESLRKHMHWEESDLFRRLDKLVADGHEIIESSTIVDHKDPLFGVKVDAQFKAVYKAITANY